MCMHICGGQRSIFGTLPQEPSGAFFEAGSFIALKLVWQAKLAANELQGTSCRYDPSAKILM